MRTWLLPDHFEDVLPPHAGRVEHARRRMLDLFRNYGYQYVLPPLLEHVESLLSGAGHDLDLKTFKLSDQLSGRLLGLRADMTPQVARIDAHLLGRRGVTRLCYAGSVVHAHPSGLHGTREPLQIGAELYGHRGVEADIEVQRVMALALRACGVRRVVVELGHVGVFRALVHRAGIAPDGEHELFLALQAKDGPCLRDLLRDVSEDRRAPILALADLYGDVAILRDASRVLPREPQVRAALAVLSRTAAALADAVDECLVDLAELRGYQYHNGMVFAAYVDGASDAVARGGRYDGIGAVFGRPRDATGFSLDLRGLAPHLPATEVNDPILAPARDDPDLARAITRLRNRGEIVIVDLPGHARSRRELGCGRQLVRSRGRWVVQTGIGPAVRGTAT